MTPHTYWTVRATFLLLHQLVLVEAMTAQSPGGVHPTVAPMAGATQNSMQASTLGLPGLPAGSPLSPTFTAHPATSPLFNPGDGTWNLGEEAGAADHGGIIDWRANTWVPVLDDASLPTPVPGTNVFRYAPGGTVEGWTMQVIPSSFPVGPIGAHYWRLRGYLGSGRLDRVTEGGFEIITRLGLDPSKPIVIAVQSPPTLPIAAAGHGIGDDIGNAFAYMGWEGHSGLWRQGLVDDSSAPTAMQKRPIPYQRIPPASPPDPGLWTANIELMQANERRNSGNAINLICVGVMPRVCNRPALFQMQRNVEIVRAVKAMLTTNVPGWRPPSMSQDLPTNWGDPVYAPPIAVIEGGSLGGAMAMWGVMFFPNDFHAAVSFGAGPSIRSWVGEEGAAQYLSSLSGFSMRSLDLSLNEVLHYSALGWGVNNAMGFAPAATWSPFFHMSAVHAWKKGFLHRPVFMGIGDEDFVHQGNETVPWISGQQEFVPAGIVSDPTTGVELIWTLVPKHCHQEPIKPFVNPFTLGVTQDKQETILQFLEHLLQVGVPPTVAPPPPVTLEDATEDCYEHALQPPDPVPPAPTSPLHLDTNFSSAVPAAVRKPGRSHGIGTRLGADDSMIIAPPWGTEGTVVFVGSAEGVVTKLTVDAQSGEVVPLAMSEPLGSGAWALAIGEEDGAPGSEVIAATHRGLHILDRTTLATIVSRRDLPWDMTRPRCMRIADVIPGGFSEIIVVSDMGRLAIYDKNLVEQFHFGEPGVVDVQVLQAGPIVDLAILSMRGHVFKLRWDTPNNSMSVLASSPRLNGVPVDMERCDVLKNGQPALAVLMRDTVPQHTESLWMLGNAPNGVLRVIDQAGSMWDVNAGGGVTLRWEAGHNNLGFTTPAPGPYRVLRKLPGIAAANAETATSALPPSQIIGPFLVPPTVDVQTFPWTPMRLVDGQWVLADRSSQEWRSRGGSINSALREPSHAYIYDGLVSFGRSGDVIDLPAGQPGTPTRHAAWWSTGDAANAGRFLADQVQGIDADPSAILGWWSTTGSTQTAVSSSVLQTVPPVPFASIVRHDLRNEVAASIDVTEAQAMRLFLDPASGAVRVALFTPGARLMVLEAGHNSTTMAGPPRETEVTTGKALDFGSGGMALAVNGARAAAGVEDIYLGPLAFFAETPPTASTSAKPLFSVLAHVEYTGASSFGSSTLHVRQVLRLDGSPTTRLPLVYGVCGMAVGEILPANAGPELVVGSLDGHLLVFGLDATTGDILLQPPGGGTSPAPAALYEAQVEGAVGCYNGIAIEDLAAPSGENELYVAGSLGLRRWVR